MYFILVVSSNETKEVNRYLLDENNLASVLSNLDKTKYQIEDLGCIGMATIDYSEIIINNKDLEKGV